MNAAMDATRENSTSLLEQLFTMRDPRTADWATIRDPTYIAVAVIGYLYMAKVWGPRYMQDRKPYSLKTTIQCYNVLQVVANVYFCSRIAYLAYGKLGYSPVCQGLKYSTDPDSMALLDSLYNYLLVRIIDFADTLFFVLKKKFSHITQLHVIHHTIVAFSGWQFMQFGAGGQAILGVCLNSIIHIFMYSYYFLAALGPHMQPYLWWKKYLTTIQIVQFFIMIGHALIPLFVDCGYPRILMLLGIPQVVLILGLFVNFYIQSYLRGKSRSDSRPHNQTTPMGSVEGTTLNAKPVKVE